MATQKLLESLWGDEGYCTLLMGPGYSEASGRQALEALEEIPRTPSFIQTEVVKATWFVPMVQITNLALRPGALAKELSGRLGGEIVVLLRAEDPSETESSNGDFEPRLARLKVHWELDTGVLGTLETSQIFRYCTERLSR
jgi:hypothetical protein